MAFLKGNVVEYQLFSKSILGTVTVPDTEGKPVGSNDRIYEYSNKTGLHRYCLMTTSGL